MCFVVAVVVVVVVVVAVVALKILKVFVPRKKQVVLTKAHNSSFVLKSTG